MDSSGITIRKKTQWESFCLYLLILVLYVMYKYWWIPRRIQFILNSQEIYGPPYQFIHGNNKQVVQMQREALSKPMGLTHDIFPRVMPHYHSWINKYGKNYLSWNGAQAQLVMTEPELVKEITMIINETLRLYPPANSTPRKVERRVRVGKLNLPAYLELDIRFLALHHDPDLWGDDVHLFKPKRFAQGVANATNHNTAAFLPFGLGPRSCVGMSFAMTEIKIAVSMLLQRYSFTLSPAYVHSPLPSLVLKPQHGIQLLFHSLPTYA